MQICHNDCGPGNALALNGKVSAILDFEFAGPDRRAIDVAVGWYWSVGPAWSSGNELPIIRAFLEGYTAVTPLSPLEIEAMPCLARLQRYASVVHWTGRHIAGTSTDERTREQVQRTLDLDLWLDAHAQDLSAILRS
jgi:Ser/Thr protein kinase RdoA (MazF antagonist)